MFCRTLVKPELPPSWMKNSGGFLGFLFISPDRDERGINRKLRT
jgi:hypothetical protein